jgi:hypothetical protein
MLKNSLGVAFSVGIRFSGAALTFLIYWMVARLYPAEVQVEFGAIYAAAQTASSLLAFALPQRLLRVARCGEGAITSSLVPGLIFILGAGFSLSLLLLIFPFGGFGQRILWLGILITLTEVTFTLRLLQERQLFAFFFRDASWRLASVGLIYFLKEQGLQIQPDEIMLICLMVNLPVLAGTTIWSQLKTLTYSGLLRYWQGQEGYAFLWLASAVTVLGSNFDVLIAVQILTADGAAGYIAVSRAALAFAILISVFNLNFAVKVSRVNEADLAGFSKAMSSARLANFFFSLLLAIVFISSLPTMLQSFGHYSLENVLVGIVLASGYTISTAFGPTGYALISLGKNREFFTATSIAMCISITAAVILGKVADGAGIALAAALYHVLFRFLCLRVVLKRDLTGNPPQK